MKGFLAGGEKDMKGKKEEYPRLQFILAGLLVLMTLYFVSFPNIGDAQTIINIYVDSYGNCSALGNFFPSPSFESTFDLNTTEIMGSKLYINGRLQRKGHS